MHGLSLVDAALVGLSWMELGYPDEAKRRAEWRRLATAIGVPLVEDEERRQARIDEQLREVAADFGLDG